MRSYDKQVIIERDGNKCTTCGTDKNLIVHHLDYSPGIGNEITLCMSCHRKWHTTYGAGKNRPEPILVQLNARIDSELLREVKIVCIEKGMSLNKFVVEAIKEELLKEM